MVIYAKRRGKKIMIEAGEGIIPTVISDRAINEFIKKFPRYKGGFFALYQGKEFKLFESR